MYTREADGRQGTISTGGLCAENPLLIGRAASAPLENMAESPEQKS
jgi:hypothetical protein